MKTKQTDFERSTNYLTRIRLTERRSIILHCELCNEFYLKSLSDSRYDGNCYLCLRNSTQAIV